MSVNEFERYTIQVTQNPLGDYWTVYGWDTHSKSSVLAGQPRKVFLKSYDTLEEAQKKYPDATLSNKWLDPQVSLNHLPSESDFVPGGAYPDDYDDDYRD